MAKFRPYFEVAVPESMDWETKRELAEEIIDFIVDRTESGRDKDNQAFPKYRSEKYADMKGTRTPDLRLTGDMLESLELLGESGGKIRIGYASDASVVGKVEGNCIGSYGQPTGNPELARNFLGVAKGDLARILAPYEKADQDDRRATDQAINIFTEDLLRNMGFSFGGDE